MKSPAGTISFKLDNYNGVPSNATAPPSRASPNPVGGVQLPAAKRRRRSSKHQMSACCSCKKRRKKCDGQYPVCSACRRQGTECTIIYAPTGQEIRKDYLETLEKEVAKLRAHEKENPVSAGIGETDPEPADDLRDSPMADPASSALAIAPKPAPTAPTTNLAQQVGMITLVAAGEKRYIGETSAYSIAEAIASSISCYDGDQTLGTVMDRPAGVGIGGTTIGRGEPFYKPTIQDAQNYLQAYKDVVHCQYPFLDWEQVTFWFDQVMKDPPENENVPGCPKPVGWEANFFIYMIFAVATQLVKSNPRLVSSAKSYYHKAFENVGPIVEHPTIHAVQAYLLMAVFSQKMPDGASVWQTTGIAIRTAVALGLHRKPYRGRRRAAAGPVEEARSRDEDLRARVFWSAYGIERINGLILGRPFSISDVDIDAPLPRETDETSVACHVVSLRRIQSNICTFIYKSPSLLGTSEELETTRVQIVLELKNWMNTFPAKRNAKSTFETDNWSFISYHNSMLLLLRPVVLEVAKLKLDAPPRSLEWFKVFTESASAICLNYKRMHLRGMLGYTWLAMQCCFVSGISFLYCVWLDRELHVLRWKRRSLIFDTICACSSILYVMGERWKAASIFRDTFEKLSRIVRGAIEEEQGDATTEDALQNGVFENGSIGIDYYTEDQDQNAERLAGKGALSGHTDGIMFMKSSGSSPEKSELEDEMDRLWEFLDSTGDRYLRGIFHDMESGIGPQE